MYLSRCLLLAVSVLLTGCGQSELAPVTGNVSFQGKPLTTGVVSFKNSASGALGYANVLADGSYSAKTGTSTGLKPGEYAVSVSATESILPTPDQREPIPKLITPARYASPETSGLRIVVPPAGGTFDLTLEAQAR